MKESPDVKKCLNEYRKNMKEDLLALWKVWVPATFANFFFAPMHLRIVGVAATSLIWTCILSVMRGGDVEHADDLIGGAVTGASYQLLQENLDERFNTSPVEMDPHLEHINVSAAGKQRPGLVALMARHVARHGGNVTHSKMVRLGQEFIMQMHVSVPPENLEGILASLKSNPALGELNIQATRCGKRDITESKAVLGMKIHCVGSDKPGMLAGIAEKISAKNMSIENIETELRMHGDKREFVVNAYVVSKNHSDKDNLLEIVKDIGTIKDDLGLDSINIRVQAGK